MSGLSKLVWTRPRGLPHGLSGACALVVGGCLLGCALAGELGPFVGAAPALHAYVVAAGANAVAGYRMAGRAPLVFQRLFRFTAAFQACLVYFCWRFSPAAAALVAPSRGVAVAAADATFAAGILLGLSALLAETTRVYGGWLALPVWAGGFALALLAGYPVQLALGGDAWWECVTAAYPRQAEGMVAYIYVPATWAFAAILFGATLLIRKIVSPLIFGGVFLGLVMSVLVGTVLAQEVHIPAVSTQRLFLPCPAPAAGSRAAALVDALDTSVLAQSVLAAARRRTGWQSGPG